MKDFTLHNPCKLVFGKSSMDQIKSNVKSYGNKVLLTYGGGSIKKNGIYNKVLKQLDSFDVKEFSGIEPNPRLETLTKAIGLAKEFKPDLILAVGGGSVIDGSKLIAAATNYDGDAWDFPTHKAIPKSCIPLATVLTLSATGSEMNAGAVITKWKSNEKRAFGHPNLIPKFSILDPQNTFSVNREHTAYGIIDAYSHVLEQYINTTLDAPLQDRMAESILLTLIENGPIAIEEPENYDARANLMFSATMALNKIFSVGMNHDWATHMIEHEFSAFYDIPHAAGLAIIHPRWMKVVKDQKLEKISQYGKRIWGLEGAKDDVALKAANKTLGFFKSLGVKTSLSEWDIGREHFETISNRLEIDRIGEVTLNKKQIDTILENCL